ncbi:hypothetical protein B0F87_10378 [Methylobacter tundripaludum]|uniref:Uncharacterized protein n=1 Tax=Methylobacter tundripaludum TaxID=173365 RepID=A0A2S6HGH2_9GAMM|nr:hypothetical protein B0F87_10378 [Methylobacter tundripaludum]
MQEQLPRASKVGVLGDAKPRFMTVDTGFHCIQLSQRNSVWFLAVRIYSNRYSRIKSLVE